jgi:hypothetical protein
MRKRLILSALIATVLVAATNVTTAEAVASPSIAFDVIACC